MDVQSTSLLLLLGAAAAVKQREDVEQSERLRAAVCIGLELWLMDAVCPQHHVRKTKLKISEKDQGSRLPIRSIKQQRHSYDP